MFHTNACALDHTGTQWTNTHMRTPRWTHEHTVTQWTNAHMDTRR